MTVWARPRKDGTPVWYYRFYWRHQKYQGYIGPVSKETAKRVDMQMKVRVAEGRYAVVAPPPPPTLDAFSERFLAWYRTDHRPQSYSRYESRLRCHIRPYLGHLRLDAITTRVLDDYRTKRHHEGAAPRSINAELTVMSHLLSKAREWDLLAAGHRPKFTRMRADETPIRVLSRAEEATLLLHCSPPLRRLIIFALHTGLRREELSTLTWAEIDGERREVVVTGERAKSRRTRRIPLNEVALTVLRDLQPSPQSSDARVFGYKSWAASFARACHRAGLQGIHPHTLRRTFATRALEAGINLHTVQRWLGHAKLTTTQLYLHPSSAYDHQAIRALEGAGGQTELTPARQPHTRRHVDADGGRLLEMSTFRARPPQSAPA